jgi:DNA-binding NtrC family response regulator
VVIVDMTLDGMSGEQFIRKLLDRNPAVAVLATSGYPGSLQNIEAPPGARIAMLEKPFTPRMLTEALAQLLGEGSSAD